MEIKYIAVAIILSVSIFSTAFGFAILGSKFLESGARQPEIMSELRKQMFLVAGLLDAVPMIGVGFSALILFS